MKIQLFIFQIFLLVVILSACNSSTNKIPNDLKAEIINVEKEFETAIKSKGLAQAFYEFADENAVIKRKNDSLIKGKENIRLYYKNVHPGNVELTWTPDFVYVSGDGTLAYTYGSYLWKDKDVHGKSTESKGIFHTIWKKQKDKSWKYLWD